MQKAGGAAVEQGVDGGQARVYRHGVYRDRCKGATYTVAFPALF